MVKKFPFFVGIISSIFWLSSIFGLYHFGKILFIDKDIINAGLPFIGSLFLFLLLFGSPYVLGKALLKEARK